jgi:Rieske [2Fe-2S] domain
MNLRAASVPESAKSRSAIMYFTDDSLIPENQIGESGDIALGAGRAFEVEDFSMAVFNVDGTLYAIDDSCPHQGSSLVSGSLEGSVAGIWYARA